MIQFVSALARIKKQYVKLVNEPEAVVMGVSSSLFLSLLALPGPFYGHRMFLLHLYSFLCCKKQWIRWLTNFLLLPLHLWTKAKECLMYSTSKPIFNIYYRLQLILKKLDIQPYCDQFIDKKKQVVADISDICRKSVENLKFVLNHECINEFIVRGVDFERIGICIFKNWVDSLDGVATLLLFQELEQKFEKHKFVKIVFGYLFCALHLRYRHIRKDMFYLVCDAYGDKYNVYEGFHGVLLIRSLNLNDDDLFTYLLTKSKQINFDAKCESDYGHLYDTPYAHALRDYCNNTRRKMLFSYGATPCVPFDYHQQYFECNEIQADLLHGLLYCFHCRNVFVFFTPLHI